MDLSRVNGAPRKSFFISTITKDITLEDCVLDLIDNCLDGTGKMLGHPQPHLIGEDADLSAFWVRIDVSPEGFSIRDNCGGISLTDAIEYAFTFGSEERPDDYSIGLYGIGMKRAIFKMGEEISVMSRFDGDGNEEPASFRVPIDVPTWKVSSDWDFQLEEAEPLPEAGVQIEVRRLYAEVAREFSSVSFVNGLRALIARDYSRFLANGLAISVNGRPIRPFVFQFLESGVFKPFRDSFRLQGVEIEIVAGLTTKPAESYDPGEDDVSEDRSGWYVICNGRIVLAADKGDLTGWGYQGRNRWHPQYRGFVGLIMFTSKNPALLPLTTTKRSVDAEREVYRLALVKMMELTRTWIDYTNARKTHLPEARDLEKQTRVVSLSEVSRSQGLTLPVFQSRATAREVSIQYAKPPSLVRNLAVAMGDATLSGREVGSRAFDYAYEELGAGQI